ncbi:MAG: S-layer homology domain-containing protein [Promicromonosporaceae bacterium]|nr:S-layer homology domain-containing protein [Promicromonosporaceae bacterium]
MAVALALPFASAVAAPVAPTSKQGIATISAGSAWFSMALRSDGSLYTWGSNEWGQLGDGTITGRHTPARVLTEVTAISAGSAHSMALRSDGSLYAWGANWIGQLGDGTTASGVPTPVRVLTGVTAISAGGSHSMALRSDGSLYAWGTNQVGQVGDGTNDIGILTPVRVLTGVTAISAGGSHSMALRSDGSLYTWGANWRGQVGDGSNDFGILTPVRVLTGVTAISAGGLHSMALRSDGSLYAWGSNEFGQLGDGTDAPERRTPVRVLTGVTAISAGGHHSMALRSDGSLYAWGNNESGQVGDGSTTDRATPVRVLTEVTAISTSISHSMALRSDGFVYAWGGNRYGGLGDGTTDDRPTPVRVLGPEGVGYLNLMVHPIAVDTALGGTALATPAAEAVGRPVVLTATPAAGQQFVRWEVTPDVAWATGSSATTNPATLVMPASAVTVTPVFAELPAATPTPTPTPTPTLTPPTSGWECPSTARFTDVEVGSQFHCHIEWLAATGITTGWADGTFRPGANVERQAMAAFLYRGLANSAGFSTPGTTTFSDKNPTDTFFRNVEWLASSGITRGWDMGTHWEFRPGANVERQAMAAFLYRAAGSPVFTAPVTATFSDVPVGAAFFREIEWLYSTGITTGWDLGEFRPIDTVERQAMAAFLYRAFNNGYLNDTHLNHPFGPLPLVE